MAVSVADCVVMELIKWIAVSSQSGRGMSFRVGRDPLGKQHTSLQDVVNVCPSMSRLSSGAGKRCKIGRRPSTAVFQRA